MLGCIRLCGPGRICPVTKVLLAGVNNYMPGPVLPQKGMVHLQGRLATGMGEEVPTVVVTGGEGGTFLLGLALCRGSRPRSRPSWNSAPLADSSPNRRHLIEG